MVRAEMQGRVARSAAGGAGEFIGVVMEYRAEDPLSVTITFETEGGPVDWVVARELLLRGSTSVMPYGEGDLRLRRSGNTIALCLTSPEGHADVLLPSLDVQVFLEASTDEVPFGSESVDAGLDAFLKEVLGS